MTWVSKTFLEKLKEIQSRGYTLREIWADQWKRKGIILLIIMIFVLLLFLFGWYLMPEGVCKSVVVVVSYIALIVLALISLKIGNPAQAGRSAAQTNPPAQTANEKKWEQLQDLLDAMRAEQISLDVFADDIRQELEQELKRVREAREKLFQLIQDVFKVLLLVPVSFLLALWFQGVFTEDTVQQMTDFSGLIGILGEVIYILTCLALLAVVLYQIGSGFAMWIDGESQLKEAITVLEEVELYQRKLAHASQTTPVSQTTPGP